MSSAGKSKRHDDEVLDDHDYDPSFFPVSGLERIVSRWFTNPSLKHERQNMNGKRLDEKKKSRIPIRDEEKGNRNSRTRISDKEVWTKKSEAHININGNWVDSWFVSKILVFDSFYPRLYSHMLFHTICDLLLTDTRLIFFFFSTHLYFPHFLLA